MRLLSKGLREGKTGEGDGSQAPGSGHGFCARGQAGDLRCAGGRQDALGMPLDTPPQVRQLSARPHYLQPSSTICVGVWVGEWVAGLQSSWYCAGRYRAESSCWPRNVDCQRRGGLLYLRICADQLDHTETPLGENAW